MNAHGQGLGLRREFAVELSLQPKHQDIDFLEVVPDNWMDIGGQDQEILDNLASKYPLIGHGLSLSIGDCEPLDKDYLSALRRFLDRYRIDLHSDHMSVCRDRQGYLYELIPVPRTPAYLQHIANKVKAVQDFISRRIVLENISYYYECPGQMPEAEFMTELVHKSDCALLLDLNNVQVNALNYGIDPIAFIDGLPADSVAYYHVAGHLLQDGTQQDGDPRVLDTHGTPVSAQVRSLAAYAATRFGPRPLVLERDNHVPGLQQLCEELSDVHASMFGQQMRVA